MKVLKGLVLTMLVSAATIFAMDVFVEGDLLTTSGQQVAKITELDTDSIVIGANGGITHDHGVAESIILADTEGQTSDMALSSVEVSIITLSRLMNESGVDKNTSSVIAALIALGKGAKVTDDAITVLSGLTSASGVISVGAYTTLQSVLNVLNSKIKGTPKWNVTSAGVITPSGVGSTDLEASPFTVTAGERVAIKLSREISSIAEELNSFTLSTLLKGNISRSDSTRIIEGFYLEIDKLDIVTNGGALDDERVSKVGLS